MENGKQPAYPHLYDGDKAESFCYNGLTKREYFAAMAMQGLLASGGDKMEKISTQEQNNMVKVAAIHSVAIADAILTELEKPQP